jgi:hypothetical protein
VPEQNGQLPYLLCSDVFRIAGLRNTGRLEDGGAKASEALSGVEERKPVNPRSRHGTCAAESMAEGRRQMALDGMFRRRALGRRAQPIVELD